MGNDGCPEKLRNNEENLIKKFDGCVTNYKSSVIPMNKPNRITFAEFTNKAKEVYTKDKQSGLDYISDMLRISKNVPVDETGKVMNTFSGKKMVEWIQANIDSTYVWIEPIKEPTSEVTIEPSKIDITRDYTGSEAEAALKDMLMKDDPKAKAFGLKLYTEIGIHIPQTGKTNPWTVQAFEAYYNLIVKKVAEKKAEISEKTEVVSDTQIEQLVEEGKDIVKKVLDEGGKSAAKEFNDHAATKYPNLSTSLIAQAYRKTLEFFKKTKENKQIHLISVEKPSLFQRFSTIVSYPKIWETCKNITTEDGLIHAAAELKASTDWVASKNLVLDLQQNITELKDKSVVEIDLWYHNKVDNFVVISPELVQMVEPIKEVNKEKVVEIAEKIANETPIGNQLPAIKSEKDLHDFCVPIIKAGTPDIAKNAIKLFAEKNGRNINFQEEKFKKYSRHANKK